MKNELNNKQLLIGARIALAVGAFALVCCGVWAYDQVQNQQIELNRVKDEADEAQEALNARISRIEQSEQATVKGTSGLDSHRPAQDGKVVRDFMIDVCNWNDTQSYNEARLRISERYQIPLENAFFGIFMPETGGNLIESQGYRLSCSNVNMHVRAINDDVYSYLVEVTLKNTQSTSDKAIGYTTVVLLVEIDSVGTMSNIEAISTLS